MSTPDFAIRDLESWADYEACVALQKETWGSDFSELVPATILRLSQKLGGIAAGAFDPGGHLIAFVFGLTGIEDNALLHWSDMLAVRPSARNVGLGEALKRYQRSVLLARNITRMRWTFDPLESRNAHLNFVRLGALAREYARDLYGDSDSPLHQGIGTDRLIITWEMDSVRVVQRLAGQSPVPSARVAARIEVPADIQSLKREDPARARQWRMETRAAFESHLGQGLVVTGFERGDPVGNYLLERADLAS